MTDMNTLSDPGQTLPWWKYGHLWMVIGGPLLVVIASFITLYLALSSPNPVYTDRAGNQSAEDHDGKGNMTPAMLARNHAATGGVAPNAAASAPAPAATR